LHGLRTPAFITVLFASGKSTQKEKLTKQQNGKNAQCRRRDWQNTKFAQKAKKEKSARNV